MNSSHEAFTAVIELVKTLRAPNGCPWDRKQTLESITPYILEECHELLDALARGDEQGICEESGDLFFQIAFLAQIESEAGRFGIQEILEHVHTKMVLRHPHVFGDTVANDVETVLTNWEKIKAAEKDKQERNSILDGVPASLPALARAAAVQRKAARVGFDWTEIKGVLEKISEEIAEFSKAQATQDQSACQEEFGDILFALVNLARKSGIDPEQALTTSTEKFIRRFHYIESQAALGPNVLGEYSHETMDRWWNEAQTLEKKPSPPDIS